MKKTLLAIAILASSSSLSAAELLKFDNGSLDFYGQLRTELKFFDSKDTKLGSGSSRTGIQANYELNDDLTLRGLVELGIRDDSDVNVRVHVVSIKSDSLGTISFGKQWTVSDDTSGADYSYFFGGSALRYSTLSGGAHDSQIKYTLTKDNFWLSAGYGLPEDDSNQELAELYAGTSFNDLSLHVGFGKNSDKNYAVGAVNADLTNTYYEGTVEYKFSDALVGITYYNATLESNNSKHEIKENGLSIAGKIKVANKTSLYGGYELTQQDPNFGDDEDGTVVYTGVEYKHANWARIYAEYGYLDGTTLGYVHDSAVVIGPKSHVDKSSNFAIGARVYW